MSRVRPSRSGRAAQAGVFLRPTTAPRAALVLGVEPPVPADWPTIDGSRVSDAPLDHAVGWTCEIRPDAVHVMNPLGEGVFAATLPSLSEAWLSEMRSAASTAIYLVAAPLAGDVQTGVDTAARRAPIPAATVRTAVHADFGKQPAVGRNDPCPCGSGRKYKQCHLR